MTLQEIKAEYLEDNPLDIDPIIVDDVFQFIEVNSYPMHEVTDRYIDENSFEAREEEVYHIVTFIEERITL